MARTEKTAVKENPEQLALAEHVSTVRILGAQIIQATLQTGEKYYDLCVYIRKHSVPPKVVTHELKALGFAKTRVSEINRIANAADDLWDKYAARAIGFNKVLALTRESTKQLQDVIPIEIEGQLIDSEETSAKAAAVAREEGVSDPKALRKACNDKADALIKAWERALKAGVRLKTSTFDLGGRVSVTVKVSKAPRVKESAPETNAE